MSTVSWILTVILGGATGLAAEKLMKRDLGVVGMIVVGVVGAVLLNAVLRGLGIVAPEMWLVQSLTAVAGAVLIIVAWRFYRTSAPADR
jgi:uncharacterized membrane protein YeaQ/YmgE (transglycosylase-associated protein family)